MSRKRVKMLIGAPLVTDLTGDGCVLLKAFVPAIHDFLHGTASRERVGGAREIKWRHITAPNNRPRTGWSQPFYPRDGPNPSQKVFSPSALHSATSFQSLPEDTTVFEASHPMDATIDTFVEHSLVFHDSLISSNIVRDEANDPTTSFSFAAMSFGSLTNGESSPHSEEKHARSAIETLSSIQMTSLSSLPTASQLRSIYPQTPTPNLLCVLTSQGTTRQVAIRRTGRTMLLHEISVADDTGSRLSISFWLPSSKTGRDAKENVSATLESLRVGDIVLLRNIALNIYQNVVYGQSLNPSITRARTGVDVLMRGNGTASLPSSEMPPAVRNKLEKVKKWASVHIVSDYNLRKRKRLQDMCKRNNNVDDSLPPDSMET
jgi:hypothetical protein